MKKKSNPFSHLHKKQQGKNSDNLSKQTEIVVASHEVAFVPASKSFLGVDGYHDFHYILDILGLISYDGLISSLVKMCAYLLMFYAIVKMLMRAFSDR